MTRKMLLGLAGVLMFGIAAYAHHSLGATYESDKEVKLEGKIVQLLLRNPHSFLQIDVPDKDGTMQRWSLEWRGSGQLGQAGIKRDTLKSGDDVTITCNPSRTPADHRGALKTLHRKSDGFGWGTKPGETIE
ncbi:MAG: hypothetical protein JWO19_44 [Bryobacterales bacterium]|nr:hypothetical protein [Bryobacterales bacterium]